MSYAIEAATDGKISLEELVRRALQETGSAVHGGMAEAQQALNALTFNLTESRKTPDPFITADQLVANNKIMQDQISTAEGNAQNLFQDAFQKATKVMNPEKDLPQASLSAQ